MGKLIVIEGGDGAGKETQAKLARAALEHARRSVHFFDFPQYETRVGGIIRRALDGKLGDFRNLHPELASLPYTLDRLAVQASLKNARELFAVTLCNRYTPSNAMYQGVKFPKLEEQDAFIDWVECLEYRELGLPEPDLVLYLYVPYDISHQLARTRGALDQHEADEAYQRTVIDLYLRTARRRPESWRVIECTEDGVMRSREAIHADVMGEIGVALCD